LSCRLRWWNGWRWRWRHYHGRGSDRLFPGMIRWCSELCIKIILKIFVFLNFISCGAYFIEVTIRVLPGNYIDFGKLLS